MPTDVVVVAQLVEQTVDTAVFGASGVPGYGGLHGFLPEQSSSPSSVEQIIDIPVPGREVSGSGGLQGFHPRARRGVSRSLPHFAPFGKSAEVTRQPSARVHTHSSSSELSAHQMPARGDLSVKINTDDDRTYCWNRQERTSHWEMPPGIRPGWVKSRDGLFVHIDTQNVPTSIAGMCLFGCRMRALVRGYGYVGKVSASCVHCRAKFALVGRYGDVGCALMD